MERIRSLDRVVLKPDIADDEAYDIIIGCIKSYKCALKLVLYLQYKVNVISDYARVFVSQNLLYFIWNISIIFP